MSEALSVLEPAPVAEADALDIHARHIRDAHRALGGALEQAGTWAVLLGHELSEAHRALGIRAGRPGKNNSATVAELNFEGWLKAEIPSISYRSAMRYMALAKGAKAAILRNGEEAIRALLAKPSASLSEEEREVLHGTIRKVTDGKTYSQLALDFGMKGPGRKTGSGGNNGAAAKAIDSVPPGWAEEEWELYRNSDDQAKEAIDQWRSIERAISAEIEAGTLAHLPSLFRDALDEQISAVAALLPRRKGGSK